MERLQLCIYGMHHATIKCAYAGCPVQWCVDGRQLDGGSDIHLLLSNDMPLVVLRDRLEPLGISEKKLMSVTKKIDEHK